MSAEYVTKKELQEAVAPLATKQELQQAIAPLATKVEMREAIAEAIAPLATKVEMREAIAEAIAPLATKVEMRQAIAEAIAPLATKVEMREAIAEAIAPLATKAELQQVKAELKHHMDLTFEALRSDIRLLAEAVATTNANLRKLTKYVKRRFKEVDARIDRLDAEVYLLKQRAFGNGGGPIAGAILPSQS